MNDTFDITVCIEPREEVEYLSRAREVGAEDIGDYLARAAIHYLHRMQFWRESEPAVYEYSVIRNTKPDDPKEPLLRVDLVFQGPIASLMWTLSKIDERGDLYKEQVPDLTWFFDAIASYWRESMTNPYHRFSFQSHECH